MISYEKLVKKPRVFKSITGLSIEEFEQLYQRFAPAWVEHERQRLGRPNRKRAIGGGRKYALKLKDQLVMVTCWLRLYLNTEAMGFFFGVDKATVSRNCRRLLKVLRALGDETLGWPDPPKRGQGKNVEQALREYPDLLAIVDTTEQRVQRPGDDERQRCHYSGKPVLADRPGKKAHTRKTAIVVNERGRIRDVSHSTPGSKHDLKHVVESQVIDETPEDVTVIGDAGFDGLQNYYPERNIGTPHKARRNHPLTPDHKLANREFSSVRIVVENTLSHMKHFKVLAHQFRHTVEVHDDAFRSVVGIINHRIDRRLNPPIAA
ncbi:MAG: transposase [Anaerolineales bacterium]|nr:transposase [Anaerolineales bacterium]